MTQLTRQAAAGISRKRKFSTGSELVLPLAQRRENARRIGEALAEVLVGGGDDRGPRDADEGIGRLLAADGRGQRRAVVAPQARRAAPPPPPAPALPPH